MVTITLYGGVREIGGNKTLVTDGDTRLFLDFGLSFSRRSLYYQEFLNPRTHSGVRDLLALGLIPPLDNLYRDDPVGGVPFSGARPFVDGVLLSHPHADHAYHVSLIHSDIPIYASEAARRILAAMAESGQSNFENEVIEHSYREPGKYQYEKRRRTVHSVQDGQGFSVGGIEVEPYSVDHSVPGSVGYILHTSAGLIAYTGDFRLHGTHPQQTARFLDALKEVKPRVLIIEGTNIDEPTGPTEDDVREGVQEVLKSYSGHMMFCTFAPRDMYRLTTLYELARRAGRQLVVSHKLAHLLSSLEGCGLSVPGLDDVLVYNPKRRWGIYDEKEYSTWERPYLDRHNAVRCDHLRRDRGDYLIYLDFFSLGELIDIEPPAGSVMLHSQTEPFNEEMEFDFERLRNWLNRFGIRYEHAHSSGHIYGDRLREVIQELSPEVLIPIHTEHPEAFAGLAQEVLIVEDGEEVVL